MDVFLLKIYDLYVNILVVVKSGLCHRNIVVIGYNDVVGKGNSHSVQTSCDLARSGNIISGRDCHTAGVVMC
jgi:hypothetical protein